MARDVVAAGGGRVVELRGDEALCVFDSPRQALRTSVAMQQRFAEAIREDPSLPLRAGIGLDAGEAVSVEGGYRGSALNLAARLSSLARPGEVLAGDGIVLMAGQVDGLSYSDRGRVRVKGFRDPVRVHRLEFELDLPREERPAGARGSPLTRWSIAAVVALVLAAAAATALLLTRGGEEESGVAADSAALLDPDSGRIVSQSAVGTTPSAVVSSGSTAWTLDADAQTISRVSSSGGRALTKAPGVTVTALALGGDALWAAYIDRSETGDRVGVAALDPSTLTLRDQQLLPGTAPSARDNPTILYAHGAIYVSGPDDQLRKLDPDSLEISGSVRLGAPVIGLAYGLDSIWATVGGEPVHRIRPKTLRVRDRIPLSTPGPGPIAVGAGSVWVADPLAGRVWRIEPGPQEQTHTISAGLAASGIAFADGAIWVANPIEGRIVRIDAATEQVRSFEVGNAPVAVSVAPAGVWSAVVAGGGRSIAASPELEGLETLPPGTCQTPVYGGSGRPDFLIVSDLPMQRLDAPVTLAMVQAIEFVLRRNDFRAGSYHVAYQACDDATAPAASATEEKCAANAKRYVATASVIAMIGPYNSGCAIPQIAIANRAEPPLPIVSPTASYVGLTRKGPGVAPDHPGGLYPTGTRNFVRVYPPDDFQGAADALLAKRLGVRRAYVFLDEPKESYHLELAYSFARAARASGIGVTGPESPQEREGFARLASELRRAGVDGVFVAGLPESARTVDFIRAVRRELGRNFVIITIEAFLPTSERARKVGSDAVGMYVSGSLVTDPAHQLPPEGQRFTKALSATQRGRTVNVYAPYAALATEVLLDAIARSDGTRGSVLSELFGVRLANSIFGPFSFDRNGDPSTNLIPIFRVKKQPPANAPAPPDRVFTIVRAPARLVR